MSRVFLALIGLVLVFFVIAHVAGQPTASRPELIPPAPSAKPVRRPAPPPAPAPITGPNPALKPVVAANTSPIPSTESRTPTIDRLVRVETRRRLAQSIRMTYLDSLITPTDSLVRRWADREGRPINILIELPKQPNAARLVPRIQSAIQQWEGLGIGLHFAIVTDSTKADVSVHWVDAFEKNRTGQADMQGGGDGAFTVGRVTIALHDSTKRALTDREIETVATHEFGHVIGLPHSGQKTDIMFPVASATALSERDRASAVLLYSLPPGTLKEPPSR